MEEKKQLNNYLSKAMNYCSRAEHCVTEVLQKLNQWEAPEEYHNKIIDYLIQENFINEERFAQAFVNDKFKFDRWGKQKITFVLKQKQIPTTIISNSLERIDPEEYHKTASQLMKKKWVSLEDEKPAAIKNKILRYMSSRGFESGLIFELLNEYFEK